MADYYFEFIAHIDERKRPENFPKEVYVREQYQQLPNDEEVKKLYNHRFQVMISNPGIVVFLDLTETVESGVTFDKRVYIPWHMISHFHGRIKLITPPPAVQEDSIMPQQMEPEPSDSKQTIQ